MNNCFPLFHGLDACRERLREIAAGKEFSALADQEETVRSIITAVREEGDVALLRFTRQFDGVEIPVGRLRVPRADLTQACKTVGERFLTAIGTAKERIEAFHRKQLRSSWMDCSEDGTILGQKVTPLQRVGVYVPGGRANYPSTVLMTATVARVAGVKEIALACPPGKDGGISPHVLAAAEVAGVDEVYQVGGAQAIAAFAWGTQTIGRVDKIVGPGNVYVVLAKKLLFGVVGIDSLPGPSEVVVVADETADPAHVAADLMAQSEHGPDSCSLLITTSEALALEVLGELETALQSADRSELIRESFQEFGGALVIDTIQEAFQLLNEAAPEHAQLVLENPWDHLSQVQNAGAIFLGASSTVPLGDYLAGPSHVLPTATTARFSSGLQVDDFTKTSSLVSFSAAGARILARDLEALAQAENLPAHYRALKVRLEGE